MISSKLSDINHNLPKVEKKWIYNDNCQRCNAGFGLLLTRQHHCRACAKSFCWYCCNNKIVLPRNFINFPKEDSTYKKNLKNIFGEKDKKEVVCSDCYNKISMLNKIVFSKYNLLCVFEYLDFKTLLQVTKVSKAFYYIGIYILNKYQQIQNLSRNNLLYTKWEQGIIYNSNYIDGHFNWIKVLIKMLFRSI